jgi:hypothetical protein
MKTAMQELRDNLNAMQIDGIIQLSLIEEEMITYMFNKALEKEKEQIVKAHNEGIWIEGKAFDDGEEYYNENYNQKIPELLYKDGTPMRKVKLGKEAEELLDEATKRFNQPNL